MRGLQKTWQGLIIVLLTVMITLNLRILFTTNSQGPVVREITDLRDEAERKAASCEQPIIVNIQNQAGVSTAKAGTASTNTPSIPPLCGKLQVGAMNFTKLRTQWAELREGLVKVIGIQRPKKGFLTIGIPSIKRVNGMTYLLQTLSSIIDRTSTQDKTIVVVTVFLADFDTQYNERVVTAISNQFANYIQMGFIQVVQVDRAFYPPLKELKRNFKDKPSRVTWRAKQVADFAFMFLYGKNLSNFYIQIEDDVICAKNFVPAIRDFIDSQVQPWAVLEFSELGFIGKLFRSEDMTKLVQYLLTFYDEQPVDWLMEYFRYSMTQKKNILRKPTLFQHMGLKSSFDITKDNKLKDRFFDSGEKKWKSDDPPGSVYTNMKHFDTYIPALVYGSGSGYFWARDAKQGDHIYVALEKPWALSRIIVETGEPKHPNDRIFNGTLDVSPRLLKSKESDKTVRCADFRKLVTFSDGRADVEDLGKKLNGRLVQCVRITIDADQKDWIIFQQIALFTEKS